MIFLDNLLVSKQKLHEQCVRASSMVVCMTYGPPCHQMHHIVFTKRTLRNLIPPEDNFQDLSDIRKIYRRYELIE